MRIVCENYSHFGGTPSLVQDRNLPTDSSGDPDFKCTGAKYLYETIYCGRARAELLIREHKCYLNSSRTSCHTATANQFRDFFFIPRSILFCMGSEIPFSKAPDLQPRHSNRFDCTCLRLPPELTLGRHLFVFKCLKNLMHQIFIFAPRKSVLP